MNTIPIEELRRILDYNPETGEFTWLVAPAYWKRAGTPAGGLRKGYKVIGWNGKVFTASRVAWALYYGEWPPHEVDHISRDPSDDRIANLRLATSGENKRNRGVRKDSGTGVKGVRLHKPTGRYQARIRHMGREFHLGLFDEIDKAAEAYRVAAVKLHGGFNPVVELTEAESGVSCPQRPA